MVEASMASGDTGGVPGVSAGSPSLNPSASTTSQKHVMSPLRAYRRQSSILHQVMTPRKMVHVAHRLAVFALALTNVFIAFHACYATMLLLRGNDNPWMDPTDDHILLVNNFLGDSTIRESPLVVSFLDNSTAPVAGAIYLHDSELASFTPCQGYSTAAAKVFESTFLRSLFDAITLGVSYNITQLAPAAIELIAPIVDCEATIQAAQDITNSKFFFLVRQRANPDKTSVLVTSLSNQQYQIADQAENGAAAVATLQFIDDMRATNVDEDVQYIVSIGYPYVKPAFRAYTRLSVSDDGLMFLRLIPRPGVTEMLHTVQTACREGFFLKAESEQSNINNYQWQVEATAKLAVSRWRWQSKPVLKDSWAWVHGIHFFIGMSLLSSLVILCLAAARNFYIGRPWMGDAFVSLSTSPFLYGVVVLVSWYINESWALREWAFYTIQLVTNSDALLIYEAPMRADLLVLYLAICGAIGQLFRERIEPLVVVGSFHIGYTFRVSILQLLPASFQDSSEEFTDDLYMSNVSPRQPGQDKISPMSFWTTHALRGSHSRIVFSALLPLFLTLVIPILYVFLRKVYRVFYPDKVHVQQSSAATAVSGNEQALLTQKRVLTLFEIAVGAKLEDRFGVLSEFVTCVFIKGTKYASTDGVYSAGFLIANKKYLLQTSDYWSIVLMKILGRRFRNIYVYDVNGSTVQQTARLVYPHTLTVEDLAKLSVGVLS